MASPTQTVAGKGIPNLLTAKGLLKILRDMFPFDSLSKMVRPHIKVFISLAR